LVVFVLPRNVRRFPALGGGDLVREDVPEDHSPREPRYRREDKKVHEDYLPSIQQLPQVKELAFKGPLTSDATLAVLKDAHSLDSLRLVRCRVTDDGLRNLRGLTLLTRLDLGGTDVTDTDSQITDRGLEHISYLSNLTDLSVYDCQFTDDGIQYLRPLKNLTSLYIGGTAITDEGVRELQGLTKLRVLRLNGTKIEGRGLGSLPASIAELDLNHSEVTDRGLANIAELTSLERLSLSGTRITDDGIGELAKMTSLRRLTVTDTAISDAGIAELQRALPGCRVMN
jgi:Leucine-rich repeat (LRR) protein